MTKTLNTVPIRICVENKLREAFPGVPVFGKNPTVVTETPAWFFFLSEVSMTGQAMTNQTQKIMIHCLYVFPTDNIPDIQQAKEDAANRAAQYILVAENWLGITSMFLLKHVSYQPEVERNESIEAVGLTFEFWMQNNYMVSND